MNIRTDLSLWQYIKNSSDVVPFKTICTYINAILNGTMNIDIPLRNLFGNFIMFLPMGIYLPYFIKKVNKSFDMDDFILNMFGALMGYGIWKIKCISDHYEMTKLGGAEH